MLLKINPHQPQLRHIQSAAEILRGGGVIAYPTDSVYAIGCSILDKKAINQLYRIKDEDRHKPMSFICDSIRMASQYAIISNFAYRIMRRVAPGPYTFILEANNIVPKIMLTKRHTVGIRIPKNEICLALAEQLENPIISTSLHPHYGENMQDPNEIHDRLKGVIDLVIDGGEIYAEPSTVIDLTGPSPEVVREGAGDISFLA
ncbi:MAG TPA: L-threonylcarbamoyladenylate synthase [Acidobacteriota bacterium]|nr:L-threonylcarbamoyladenylate synthase [Acidobacteriota bacterium]HQF86356.1 L-threonylcarbamoyladenylate synthase [Acidobacteriota bacterium]HQG90401.1 L-threonylcarbamoyladenylate synthase [Acidobacteriota bacterium]HQK89370.1 L-threonylcarbamoyladenylate synthase [Acidobacteriota bacterium]